MSKKTQVLACVLAVAALVVVATEITRSRLTLNNWEVERSGQQYSEALANARPAVASQDHEDREIPNANGWTQGRLPVTGRVLTAEGVPLPEARISAQGVGGMHESVLTDQAGCFVLMRPEWPQKVSCLPPIGWRVVPRQIALHEPPQGEILFVASAVGTSRIAGIVLERATGEGVPFFQLTVAGWTSSECLSDFAVSSSYDIELLGELVETDRNGYFVTECSFHREGRRVRIWPHDDVRIGTKGSSPIFSAPRVPSITEPLYVDVGPACRLSLRGHDVDALQLRALLLPGSEALGEVPDVHALVPVRLDDDWPWVRFPSDRATVRDDLQILLISEGPDPVIGVSGGFNATKASWAMVDVILSRAATLTVDLQGVKGDMRKARIFLDAPEFRPASVRVLPLGAGGRVSFGPVVPGLRVLRICDEEREVHRADLFLIEGEHLEVHIPALFDSR